MTTPTYAQYKQLSSALAGLSAETIEERLLTLFSVLASGQNPDGTAAPGQGGSSVPLPSGQVGTHAARPAASSVANGYLYWETDTTTLFVSNGVSAWTNVASGGAAGVTTFNTRSGVVTLSKADVTGTGLAAADVGADVSGAAAAEQTRALAAEALLAPLASPALTGTPTAPTATAGTNTTQIATTAFVQSASSVPKYTDGGTVTTTYTIPNPVTPDDIVKIKLTASDTAVLTFPTGTNAIPLGFTLQVFQPSAGAAGLVTWPGSVSWPGASAPTLQTANSAVDVFTFLSTDGGTTWEGFGGAAQTTGAGFAAFGGTTAGTTTSTSYVTTLTTSGATPTGTVTVPANGKLKITISAQVFNSGANLSALTYQLSGANTVAAADSNGTASASVTVGQTETRVWVVTGLTPGATTVTVAARAGAGTATFNAIQLVAETVPW